MMKFVKNIIILNIFIQVVVKTSPISTTQASINLNKRNESMLNSNDGDKNTTSHGAKASNGVVNETSGAHGRTKSDNTTSPTEEEETNEILNVTARYEEIDHEGTLIKLIETDEYISNTNPVLDHHSNKNKTKSQEPAEESKESAVPCPMHHGQGMPSNRSSEMIQQQPETSKENTTTREMTDKPIYEPDSSTTNKQNATGTPNGQKNEERPFQNATMNANDPTQSNRTLVLPDPQTNKIRNANNDQISLERPNETGTNNKTQNIMKSISTTEGDKTSAKLLESNKAEEDVTDPFPGNLTYLINNSPTNNTDKESHSIDLVLDKLNLCILLVLSSLILI